MRIVYHLCLFYHLQIRTVGRLGLYTRKLSPKELELLNARERILLDIKCAELLVPHMCLSLL